MLIPACDLLSGKSNTSPEEALAAFASWGAVHGSMANYTRMALSLVDSYFRRGPAAPPAQPAPPYQVRFLHFVRLWLRGWPPYTSSL